jgi:hypothetical protein
MNVVCILCLDLHLCLQVFQIGNGGGAHGNTRLAVASGWIVLSWRPPFESKSAQTVHDYHRGDQCRSTYNRVGGRSGRSPISHLERPVADRCADGPLQASTGTATDPERPFALRKPLGAGSSPPCCVLIANSERYLPKVCRGAPDAPYGSDGGEGAGGAAGCSGKRTAGWYGDQGWGRKTEQETTVRPTFCLGFTLWLLYVDRILSTYDSRSSTPESPRPYLPLQHKTASPFPPLAAGMPPLTLKELPTYIREFNTTRAKMLLHIYLASGPESRSVAVPVVLRFLIPDVLRAFITLGHEEGIDEPVSERPALIVENLTVFGPREKASDIEDRLYLFIYHASETPIFAVRIHHLSEAVSMGRACFAVVATRVRTKLHGKRGTTLTGGPSLTIGCVFRSARMGHRNRICWSLTRTFSSRSARSASASFPLRDTCPPSPGLGERMGNGNHSTLLVC